MDNGKDIYKDKYEAKEMLRLFIGSINNLKKDVSKKRVTCYACKNKVKGLKEAFIPPINLLVKNMKKIWLGPDDIRNSIYCSECTDSISYNFQTYNQVRFYPLISTLKHMTESRTRYVESSILAMKKNARIRKYGNKAKKVKINIRGS